MGIVKGLTITNTINITSITSSYYLLNIYHVTGTVLGIYLIKSL